MRRRKRNRTGRRSTDDGADQARARRALQALVLAGGGGLGALLGLSSGLGGSGRSSSEIRSGTAALHGEGLESEDERPNEEKSDAVVGEGGEIVVGHAGRGRLWGGGGGLDDLSGEVLHHVVLDLSRGVRREQELTWKMRVAHGADPSLGVLGTSRRHEVVALGGVDGKA